MVKIYQIVLLIISFTIQNHPNIFDFILTAIFPTTIFLTTIHLSSQNTPKCLAFNLNAINCDDINYANGVIIVIIVNVMVIIVNVMAIIIIMVNIVNVNVIVKFKGDFNRLKIIIN